jgi:glycosyltransferase involved in cell wall biosynthesis
MFKLTVVSSGVYVHVIPTLGVGGAENILAYLCSMSSSKHIILTIFRCNYIFDARKGLSPPQIFYIWPPNISSLIFLLTIICASSQKKANLYIVGWLYLGCIFAAILAIISRLKFSWNIRHNLDALKKESLSVMLSSKACALISRMPSSITYNSYSSLQNHVRYGYCGTNAIYIPNFLAAYSISGLEKDLLPLTEPRNSFETQEKLALGHLARFHPMKGHLFFLESLLSFLESNPKPLFYKVIMGGKEIDEHNPQLSPFITLFKEYSVDLSLVGPVQDLYSFYSQVDLFISSSLWGEGFPNVILEAIFFGSEVMASDIGDNNLILDPFYTYKSGSISSFQERLINICCTSRSKRELLLSSIRSRHLSMYSPEAVIPLYERAWRS